MVRNRSRSDGPRRVLGAEETSFSRMVEELARSEDGRERSVGEPARADEFTCAGCHLVQHAARRAEPDGHRCVDCAPQAAATR